MINYYEYIPKLKQQKLSMFNFTKKSKNLINNHLLHVCNLDLYA